MGGWGLTGSCQVPNILAEVRDPLEATAGEVEVGEEEGTSGAEESEVAGVLVDGEAPQSNSPAPHAGGLLALCGRAAAALPARDRRRLALFDRAILLQAALVVVLYLIMGCCGYAMFGGGVDSNVLVSFPLSDPFANAARVGVSLVGAVSYPMLHFTSRMMLHAMMQARRPPPTLCCPPRAA